MQESFELEHHLSSGTNSFAQAASFFPQPDEFRSGARRISESHPSGQNRSTSADYC